MIFYIIATPIGNYKDMTLRSIEVLEQLDFVVCEHAKEFRQLCLALNIPIKEHIECKRNREQEAIPEIIDLIKQDKKGALVSDCGTPLFEDPGYELLQSLRSMNVKLISLPGASSLMTALPLARFEIKDFYFAGFIPQKKEIRERELIQLLKRKETIILLETPYRLLNLLELLVVHEKQREILLPYNLTMEDEKIYQGKPKHVHEAIKLDNVTKGEFLIIISPLK